MLPEELPVILTELPYDVVVPNSKLMVVLKLLGFTLAFSFASKYVTLVAETEEASGAAAFSWENPIKDMMAIHKCEYLFTKN
jgi:hypothetical protein